MDRIAIAKSRGIEFDKADWRRVLNESLSYHFTDGSTRSRIKRNRVEISDMWLMTIAFNSSGILYQHTLAMVGRPHLDNER